MNFQRNNKNTGSFVMSQSGQTYETQESGEVSIEENLTSSRINLVATQEPQEQLGRFKGVSIVILLSCINLINYSDRFTIASESKFIIIQFLISTDLVYD